MTAGNRGTQPNNITGPLEGVATDSRIVAVGILASRVTGFGRVTIMAAVLGPTYFGNLFQFCSLIPMTLYSFLMGALMSPLLVPPLVRHITEGNSEAAGRFTNAALGTMIAVLFCGAALTIIGLPLLISAITPDVGDPLLRSEHLQLGVWLALMQMPQTILYAVIGTGVAVQQAHRRFALAAAAPVIENIGVAVVLITSAIVFGTGVDVNAVSSGHIMFLGLGTTAAVAVHAAVQWWGAYRSGITLVPRPDDWREKDVLAMLRQGTSSIGFTGLYWCAFLLAAFSASIIPGGLVAFQMASSLCYFPVSLTALPLSLAQLPRLSSNHYRNQLAEFQSSYWAGLRLVIFVALPASLMLATIPLTLASALTFGLMHTPTGTALLAACIGGLGIGVIGESMFTLITSSCYARNEKSLPLKAMLLRLMVVGAGAASARAALTGPQLLWMLGLTVSAANIVAGVYLHMRLRRTLHDASALRGMGMSELILAAVSILPAVLLATLLGGDSPTMYRAVSIAVIAVTCSIATYLGLHFLRGSLELELVFPAIAQVRFFGRISPRRATSATSRRVSDTDSRFGGSR